MLQGLGGDRKATPLLWWLMWGSQHPDWPAVTFCTPTPDPGPRMAPDSRTRQDQIKGKAKGPRPGWSGLLTLPLSTW